jgi:nitroreductase
MRSKVLEIIQQRHSIRRYEDRPVEDEKIELLLEAARLAPSAQNRQPWRFIVIKNRELIESLSRYAPPGTRWANAWMRQAPCVIVGCGAPHPLVHSVYRGFGMNLLPIDIGIAMEHIVLMATELGLGTCWIGWFSERKVRSLLSIPKRLKVIALLTVGYPKGRITPKPRKSLEEICSFRL